MKSRLWRPHHEEDDAFRELARQVALPIAGGLIFLVAALLWWACWQLSDRFLT
jgi:hypothetical protein